jgi:hypothetical protein
MSRRARGVGLWAALRSLGRRGLADLIERTSSHAQRFADRLREARLRDPQRRRDQSGARLVRHAGVTRATVARIQEDGVLWCGTTEWQGRTAMRLSVSSWATTEDDVRLSLEAIESRRPRCARRHGHILPACARLLSLPPAPLSTPLLAESAAGLHWTAPQDGSPDRRRRCAPRPAPSPPRPGDTAAAECVVYFFGAGQGGSVEANIRRWKVNSRAPESPRPPSSQANGSRRRDDDG